MVQDRWFWWTLCALGIVVILGQGCAGQQTAQKVAIQRDGDSCNDRAMAIIRVAKTCEDAVTNLNELVRKDRACANVFHASDPVATCQGVGVQP